MPGVVQDRNMAQDISHSGGTTFRPNSNRGRRRRGQRVDGWFVYKHGQGTRTSPHRTQPIRAESMVRAHRVGASFGQRLPPMDHGIC